MPKSKYSPSLKQLKLVKIPFLTSEIHSNYDNCGIYCLYNIITHKFYIGSAKKLISRRSSHFIKLKENRHDNIHVQRSWNKYGKDAFIFIVLDFCVPEKTLEREQYYIDLHRAADKNHGYNISTTAGIAVFLNGTSLQQKMLDAMMKKFSVFDDKGNIYYDKNARNFCKKHKIPYESFCQMLRGKVRVSGKKWRLLSKDIPILNNKVSMEYIEKLPKEDIEHRMRKTIREYKFYSPSGNLITIKNLRSFCRENKLCPTIMGYVYRGKTQKPHKGYISAKNEEITNWQKQYKKGYYVFQDKENNIIKTNNLRDFAKKNNYTLGCLYNLINGETKEYKNLRFIEKYGHYDDNVISYKNQ